MRFIPARAGNSHEHYAVLTRRTVYPRPCGEQMFEAPRASISCGLSPPVRGTVLVTLGARVAGRFIPARAGNR